MVVVLCYNCIDLCVHVVVRFPLYLKGTEKALFQYAVHLLNKDIGQVCMNVCMYVYRGV